jgi:hypothetical protein
MTHGPSSDGAPQQPQKATNRYECREPELNAHANGMKDSFANILYNNILKEVHLKI